MNWAVINRKHLPMIELAAVQEKQRQLRQQAQGLLSKAKRGGAL
jgi:hypothetical protein